MSSRQEAVRRREGQSPEVKVTITLEFGGEYSSIEPVLAELGQLFRDVDIRVVDQRPEASWWDEERAAQFAAELKTPALVALRHIASGAPKVEVGYVQAEMARAGIPMTPGTLSSIGFAVRRLRCPAPFTRDAYQRAYIMDPEVAPVLLAALEAEERRRRNGAAPRRRRRPPGGERRPGPR